MAEVKPIEFHLITMIINVELMGNNHSVDVESGSTCSQVRSAAQSQVGRDLSNITFYDKSTSEKLSDSDPCPRRIFGLKSKNESN